MKATARKLKNHPRRQTFVLASYFQLCWLLTASIVALTGQHVSGWWLLVVIPIFWIPFAIEALTTVHFPATLQVHFYLFVSFAAVMGDVFDMYNLVAHWDTVAHFDSGILLAWLGFFMVRTMEITGNIRLPRWSAIIIAFIMPMALAAMWEIVEFMSDNLIHTTAQNGLVDTMVDMIAAAIGASLTILFVRNLTPKNVRPEALLSPPERAVL